MWGISMVPGVGWIVGIKRCSPTERIVAPFLRDWFISSNLERVQILKTIYTILLNQHFRLQFKNENLSRFLRHPLVV